MMTKILFNITEWLLTILKTRGVDITTLNPKTKKDVEVEYNKNQLVGLQAQISIKRAEIIDGQRDLLGMIEPTLFNVLGQTNDSWEKTTVTKLWFDKLRTINNLIDEHQVLIKEFEDTYVKIENIK
jgi:hypothetical protein